jgi:hypothetical protein
MTERQALIALFIGMMAVTFSVVRSLISWGVDSEVMALASMLILCVGGFGVGKIVTRYHR